MSSQTTFLFASVALVLLITGTNGSAQTQPQHKAPPAPTPGRFQLFQGEYLFINFKGEGFREKTLFKLDTATGEIFICEGRQFDGKLDNKPGRMIQRHSCVPFEKEMLLDLPKEK